MISIYVRDLTEGQSFELDLPMDETALLSKISTSHEYLICSTEGLSLSISEFADIVELNKDIAGIKDIELFNKVASYDSYFSVKDVLDIIENNRYHIYEDVQNDEELGEALFEHDRALPFSKRHEKKLKIRIPEELADSGYIDFDCVGRNYRLAENRVRFCDIAKEKWFAVEIKR